MVSPGSNNCINVYTNRGSGLEVAYQIEGNTELKHKETAWIDRLRALSWF